LDKSDLDAKKRKKDSAPLEKLQFLEFSYPDAQQLTAQKKTRILRFLHTHSHAGQISDPEHDLSILIETKQVLSDLLCLIQKDDDRHFDQMKALVTK